VTAAGRGEALIEATDIHTRFGDQSVHSGVSFAIRRGELVAVIGGSGSGKSTLLRELVGLQRPTSGQVTLFGEDIWSSDGERLDALRRRVGMLFQDGALFSSMSVGENVAVPMVEHTTLGHNAIERLVRLRMALVGLKASDAEKMPSELSGGMRKRAGIARALALEPEVLFLDEPTSGLDPVTARQFDQLLLSLNRSAGLTVLLITHDLDTLLGIASRIVVLGEGKVVVDGTLDQVRSHDDPWIRSYFGSREAS
jgi:phospholipid/cholesterol/gamma-HCH transport system ATP-binding protein